MTHCLFVEYVEAYTSVRAVLARAADGDGPTALLQILPGLPLESQRAFLLGYDDVMCGRPMRAHVHFCRLHDGPCRAAGDVAA